MYIQKETDSSNLLLKGLNFFSLQPVAVMISQLICGRFHCCPLHSPECLSWPLWNDKDFVPCPIFCKSNDTIIINVVFLVPQCVIPLPSPASGSNSCSVYSFTIIFLLLAITWQFIFFSEDTMDMIILHCPVKPSSMSIIWHKFPWQLYWRKVEERFPPGCKM